MKVLVGCEESGIVRDAFIARGHEALSCDLKPTRRPGPHYQGDVFDVIDYPWDLAIFHFPCTHSSVSGARHFEAKRMDGRLRRQFALAARLEGCCAHSASLLRASGVGDFVAVPQARPNHPTLDVRARRDEGDVPVVARPALAGPDKCCRWSRQPNPPDAAECRTRRETQRNLCGRGRGNGHSMGKHNDGASSMTTPHELPVLPVHKGCLYLHGTASVSQVFGYTAGQMEAYARAAIDHALARSGAEAVAWIVEPGDTWVTLDAEEADEAMANGVRVFPLYAAPPAAAGVPEGWVLVPCTPTMKMLNAGRCGDTAIDIYNAMLASAPQPTEPVTIADIQPPAIDDPKVLETMEYGDAALETVEAALTQPQGVAVDERAINRLAVWMAEHDGHDPFHLIYEGSPPEPWGEVWCRYADDAERALKAALAGGER